MNGLPNYDAWKLQSPPDRPAGNEDCADCIEAGGLCDDCARDADLNAADWHADSRDDR